MMDGSGLLSLLPHFVKRNWGESLLFCPSNFRCVKIGQQAECAHGFHGFQSEQSVAQSLIPFFFCYLWDFDVEFILSGLFLMGEVMIS